MTRFGDSKKFLATSLANLNFILRLKTVTAKYVIFGAVPSQWSGIVPVCVRSWVRHSEKTIKCQFTYSLL